MGRCTDTGIQCGGLLLSVPLLQELATHSLVSLTGSQNLDFVFGTQARQTTGFDQGVKHVILICPKLDQAARCTLIATAQQELETQVLILQSSVAGRTTTIFTNHDHVVGTFPDDRHDWTSFLRTQNVLVDVLVTNRVANLFQC